MLAADMPPLDEATLIHFGVKGMRWGVRKEEPKGGSSSKKKETSGKAKNPYALDENDRAILKAAGVKPSDSESFKDKYGPGSLKKDPPKPPNKLSDEQKKTIAKVMVIGGVAAATWYLYHRANKVVQDDYFNRINPVARAAGPQRDLSAFRREWMTYQNTAATRQAGYSKQMVDKLSNEPVSLKAGTIFKRVSTEAEDTIRPGGFYAAHRDEDVSRYKAILPVFWKSWGKSAKSGYVVNIKANGDVKAPSPRKTFDMIKGMLNDEIETPYGGKRRFRDYFGGFGNDDDDVARRVFPQAAANWNNENHPGTKHFFGKLRGEGYNAVVDMNDAGSLSARPMRLIDGKMFEIAGHERLSSNAIITAQENIKAIAHAAMALMGQYTLAGEAYLAHAGVKGMKWGVRKAKEQLTDPKHKRRNEVILKTAVAVGAVAVAAILLKRGGVKLSSPTSKKISLAGAKMSLRILQKTGRMMATTSVKLGQTVGKTAVKGTAKVGTLVGKGAYKGALAGGKAGGRAIAQNGSKFYEKVLKKSAISTMKLSSHAMYKFTGRGKPIVNEVAKKSFNLSPTDLLLNVRADQWRGR